MTLWQMSVSGAALIVVILVLRALMLWRLPKRTFVFLWGIAALRLIVPFAVSSAYSVWSLWQEGGTLGMERPGDFTAPAADNLDAYGKPLNWPEASGIGKLPELSEVPGIGKSPGLSKASGAGETPEAKLSGSRSAAQNGVTAKQAPAARSHKAPDAAEPGARGGHFAYGTLLWACGSALSILFFLSVYLRECREFAMALPVANPRVQKWQEAHLLLRPYRIRQSDRVGTPLSYGILRPVILLPKELNEAEETTLLCVLEHEFVHVRRFDSLAKLWMTLVVCVHWFNPLAWVMLAMFNRDLELSCDEAALQRLGQERCKDYALALIYMAEMKNGLVPLANGFSRNGLEERIRVIMKRKRISWAAFLATVFLAAGALWIFGTTAEPKRVEAASLPSETDWPGAEQEKITALMPDGFEGWTVREYQEWVWKTTDTAEYRELLERLPQEEAFYDQRDEDETAAFVYYVLLPLTGDVWRTREFGGYATVVFREGVQLASEGLTADGEPEEAWSTEERAVLEYFLTLAVTDRDKLTVGGYKEARERAEQELQTLFFERSKEELGDPERMNAFLKEAARRIGEAWSRDGLELAISFYYVPLTFEPETELQIKDEAEQAYWENMERQLAPYAGWGLTWEYMHDGDGFLSVRMAFEGKEVRGIWDPAEMVWITEHAGDGAFGSEAVELVAVYENGQLTGLRPANEEEQKEWDAIRRQNAEAGRRLNADGQETRSNADGQEMRLNADGQGLQLDADGQEMRPDADGQGMQSDMDGQGMRPGTDEWKPQPGAGEWAEREPRSYPNGTESDYRSLFSEVMTDGWQELALSEFNGRLLDWCNRHYEAMERIGTDSFYGDYAVELSEEEKYFVAVSMDLSRSENALWVASLNGGGPQEDNQVGNGPWLCKERADGSWCQLRYRFSYHIEEPEQVTVRERDQAVSGMRERIEAFWAQSSLDSLLKRSEDEVAALFQDYAAQCSTERIAVEVEREGVQFEYAGR